MKTYILAVLAWLPFQLALSIATDWSLFTWRWWLVNLGAVLTVALVWTLAIRKPKRG